MNDLYAWLLYAVFSLITSPFWLPAILDAFRKDPS